jgi:hypothetical protein
MKQPTEAALLDPDHMSTSNKTARLEQLKAALYEPGSTICAAQKFAGAEVRAKSMAAFGRMVDAHLLVTGVLGGMLLRTDGKRIEDGHSFHARTDSSAIHWTLQVLACTSDRKQ